MIYTDLAGQYFDWLYERVCGDWEPRGLSFHRLLTFLYNQNFTPSCELDGARAEDGLDLRYRFAQTQNVVYAKSSEDSAKRYSDKAKNVIAEAKSEYSGGYYKTYDLTALKGSWKKLSPVKGPYQYYCDIAVPDLTERHSPFCSTGLESYAAAVAAGLANAVETRNGALRLFAIRVPTKDIELVLTIFGVGTTSYELTLPVRD